MKSVQRCRRAGPRRKARPAAPVAPRWGLHGPAGERKYLNEDERRRFIRAARKAPPFVRTLCLTLVYTGCRLSEALGLTAADIELVAGMVCIRSLKKRHEIAVRHVPSPPAFLSELARVHGLKDLDPLTGELRLWSWGRTRAWQHVKAVMAAAGLVALAASPKGLRHSFGVHAILCGVPITLVQRWLGHKDLATTAIYTNVAGPEERRLAARMWSG